MDLFGHPPTKTATKTNNVRDTSLFAGDTDDEDEETIAERTKQHWQRAELYI